MLTAVCEAMMIYEREHILPDTGVVADGHDGMRATDLTFASRRSPRKSDEPTFQVGDRVWFVEEKRPYRVRAVGDRFVVCTKPHNPMHTVLYTVMDLQECVRSTEGLVFGLGAETDQQCQEVVARLESGETELSRRNAISMCMTGLNKG
jgi:hypothetical protein